jgi:hypothetical protein
MNLFYFLMTIHTFITLALKNLLLLTVICYFTDWGYFFYGDYFYLEDDAFDK